MFTFHVPPTSTLQIADTGTAQDTVRNAAPVRGVRTEAAGPAAKSSIGPLKPVAPASPEPGVALLKTPALRSAESRDPTHRRSRSPDPKYPRARPRSGQRRFRTGIPLCRIEILAPKEHLCPRSETTPGRR